MASAWLSFAQSFLNPQRQFNRSPNLQTLVYTCSHKPLFFCLKIIATATNNHAQINNKPPTGVTRTNDFELKNTK